MRPRSTTQMMRLRIAEVCGLAAAGALALGVAGAAQGNGGAYAQQRTAVAELHNANGNTIGTARFQARHGKLRVRIAVAGLTPGFHGFHVHSTGRCDAPGFTTAGGHAHTAGQTHGAHAGDMPPLLVLRDGTATMSFQTDSLTLQELLAGDGSALIIHDARDNLANIPDRYHSHTPDATSTTFGPDATTLATGDAGARAACGIIARRGHGHHDHPHSD